MGSKTKSCHENCHPYEPKTQSNNPAGPTNVFRSQPAAEHAPLGNPPRTGDPVTAELTQGPGDLARITDSHQPPGPYL